MYAEVEIHKFDMSATFYVGALKCERFVLGPLCPGAGRSYWRDLLGGRLYAISGGAFSGVPGSKSDGRTMYSDVFKVLGLWVRVYIEFYKLISATSLVY